MNAMHIYLGKKSFYHSTESIFIHVNGCDTDSGKILSLDHDVMPQHLCAVQLHPSTPRIILYTQLCKIKSTNHIDSIIYGGQDEFDVILVEGSFEPICAQDLA